MASTFVAAVVVANGNQFALPHEIEIEFVFVNTIT